VDTADARFHFGKSKISLLTNTFSLPQNIIHNIIFTKWQVSVSCTDKYNFKWSTRASFMIELSMTFKLCPAADLHKLISCGSRRQGHQVCRTNQAHNSYVKNKHVRQASIKIRIIFVEFRRTFVEIPSIVCHRCNIWASALASYLLILSI